MIDDELRGLIELLRQENAAAHAETRREMRVENAAAHAETRREMRVENAAAHAETRREMRVENAAAHAETRREMSVENAAGHAETRRYLDQKVAENRDFFEVWSEGTRHEIGLMAEKVVRLDEKLDGVKNELEERMERNFAETQAMIKFSHAELDRRIRTLEENQRTLEEN